MTRKKAGGKLPPFVAMLWKMLNHKACTTLPPTAGQMLPYFLGKVKLKITDPTYYHARFTFTYTEAERLGCSRRSFYRVIQALMKHGSLTLYLKVGGAGAPTRKAFLNSQRDGKDSEQRYSRPSDGNVSGRNKSESKCLFVTVR